MTDRSILESRLAEAREALHDLMMGAAVVSIDRDGRRVEFRSTTAAQLRSYIGELETALGRPGRRRPLRPFFGG